MGVNMDINLRKLSLEDKKEYWNSGFKNQDEEVMYYIYITDEEDNIEGVVPLKDLILYPPETKIKEIMDTTVSRVKHDDEINKVIEKAAKYDLLSVPVIDENKKLVGIVIIHDLVDEFLYPLWKKKN